MEKVKSTSNILSSVNLAIVTLACLAVTSILGTVIPQGKPPDIYVSKYGEKIYGFISLFDIDTMYSSWWFLALIGLLGINLAFCTMERLPRTWKKIHSNNLTITAERIGKMGNRTAFASALSVEATASNIKLHLAELGWKTETVEKSVGTILISQKGRWSRLGVYVVHVSVLIILLGAVTGHFFGYKGSILLPETISSDKIFPFDEKQPIELGFSVRCDRFDIDFYANGSPKEYRSLLTILENGREVLQKEIEVNAPLTYKGVTFYQASYQAYSDFSFWVNSEGKEETYARGHFQNEIVLQNPDLRFGVINIEAVGDRAVRLKIWFSDGKGPPSIFWMDNGAQTEISRSDKTYLFTAKQRYGTGLQVAKDPGVWIIYLGCTLMLAGLCMSFFMSHRRIWLLVREEGQNTMVLLGGTANKHKSSFETQFNVVAENINRKN